MVMALAGSIPASSTNKIQKHQDGNAAAPRECGGGGAAPNDMTKAKGTEMSKWSETEGAKGEFFRGDDFLDDQVFTLTVEAWEERELKNPDGAAENKVCLTFKEDARILTMTKTRGAAMAKAFGDDMDKWVGQYVQLYGVETSLGMGVRVRKSKSAPKAAVVSQFGDDDTEADPTASSRNRARYDDPENRKAALRRRIVT
jgi:hypothetical protein